MNTMKYVIIMRSLLGAFVLALCLSASTASANHVWTVAHPSGPVTSPIFDLTNGVLYAHGNQGPATTGVYRCLMSTGCDELSDWAAPYNPAFSSVARYPNSVFDSAGGVLYMSYNIDGPIVRCVTSTGCDASSDWTRSRNIKWDIDGGTFYHAPPVIDSVNRVLYVGAGAYTSVNTFVIYRCDIVATSCDADGDWQAINVNSTAMSPLAFDPVNNMLYAATNDESIISTGNYIKASIYRCPTSTGCDQVTDWTTIWTAPPNTSHVEAITVDTANSEVYASVRHPTSPVGTVIRCDLLTGCNTTLDWYTGYSAPPSLFFNHMDYVNGILYGSTVYSGKLYYCLPVSGCDGFNDWIQDPGVVSGYKVRTPTFDSVNGILYSAASGVLYRKGPDSSSGTITVTSTDSSASWTITGPATLTGTGLSATYTAQPTGAYTITWGAVSGYTAPASQSFTLTPGGTISFNGTYTAATPTINVHF